MRPSHGSPEIGPRDGHRVAAMRVVCAAAEVHGFVGHGTQTMTIVPTAHKAIKLLDEALILALPGRRRQQMGEALRQLVDLLQGEISLMVGREIHCSLSVR